MSKILDSLDAAEEGMGKDPLYVAEIPHWVRFLASYGEGYVILDATQVNGLWHNGKSVEISLKSGKIVNVKGTLGQAVDKLGIKVNYSSASASESESEKE